MKHATLIAAALIGLTAFAQQAESPLKLDAGLDIRLRYDFTDHLPKWPNFQSDRTDYMRLRTRIWGKAEYENIGLFARLADEFRYYRTPKDDPAQDKQKFPDVLYIDNLYLDVKKIAGALDLRIGRQDMKFGAGRVISDGTGGDGSRSAYFDALRATWRLTGKTTLDAFGIYMSQDDWLPTLGQSYDGKNAKGDYDTTGFQNNEAGAGLYAQIRESKALGLDFYWVWKHETASPKFAARDFHTVGTRLLPQLTETLSGELELAGQFGKTDDDRSIWAGMAFGGLTWQPKAAGKPTLTAALLYLSGDNERFDKTPAGADTGWNPVFNRQTWLGEAVAPMYEKYRYSNLIYPYLELGASPLAGHKTKIQLGPMFTAKTEQGVNDGEGYGSFRGFYVQTRYEFPILEKMALKGAVMAEYMSKGDYFGANADSAAYFLRFQLTFDI